MDEERVLRVEDGDGWGCRLERWYSDHMGEWFTGVCVCKPDGQEVFHCGMSQVPMSETDALDEIRMVRALMECGDLLRGEAR